MDNEERANPMRLLITEKDPMVRQWLGYQAEDLGIEVTFAKDRGETLEAINTRTPDCVVMDVHSSAEEDAPLWNQLRQDPATHHIPVLLYSSSDRWQCVAELAGEQVDGFISRPFTADNLVHAAQRVSRPKRVLA